MKKLFKILSITLYLNVNAQTWVTIPDANFVTYLQSIVPAAMSGNQLNTSSALVTTTIHKINVEGLGIANLSGIQYFSSLDTLICNSNSLTSIPALPNSLTYLNCSLNYSFLTSLPSLPNSITWLDCHENAITNLPTIPNSLTYINCSLNPLSNLPALPNSLLTLICVSNSLTSLPTLPNFLTSVFCSNNNLHTLPALPNSLITLYCNSDSLTSLPALPNSLTYIDCSSNSLASIPALSNSLTYIDCNSNFLTSLPALPNSLNFIDCSVNPLPSLPTLPNSLQTLWCSYDSLTSLPSLPISLSSLACDNNKIICFPTFPNSISSISIWNNPYTCLPNYLITMDSTTLATPVCVAGNPSGCPIGDTCFSGVNFLCTQDATPHTWDIYPNYSPQIINAIWYWGDGTSSNGLYPSHTYSSPGGYDICVTAYTSCGDSSSYCKIDSIFRLANNSPYNNMVYVNVKHNTAGIEQVVNNSTQVNVYPNPFSNNIVLQSSNELGTVQVYNVLSQSVYKTSTKEKTLLIDLSNQNAGVYYVQVQGTTLKVIKQ